MRTMISGMKWKTLGLPRAWFISTKHSAEEEESMFYFYYKKFKSSIQKPEDPSVSTFKQIFWSIVGHISASVTAGPILIARFSEAVHAPNFESAERMEYVFNVDGTLDDDKIITELTPSHHLTVFTFNSAGELRYKYKYLLPFRNYKKIRLEGKLVKGWWIVYIHGDFQKYLEESESRKYMNVVFKELTDSVDAGQTSGEL